MLPDAMNESLAVARETAAMFGCKVEDEDALRRILNQPEPQETHACVTLKDFQGETLTLDIESFAKLVKGRPNWHAWSEYGIGHLVEEATNQGDQGLAKRLAEFKAKMKGVAVAFGPEGWTPFTHSIKKFKGGLPKDSLRSSAGDDDVRRDIEEFFSKNKDAK